MVSMEHAEDVAVHHPTGLVTLEQTKSALTQNPLSNYADDFWKAIAHWLNGDHIAAAQGSSYEYRFYVTPKHQGDWSDALSNATSTEEIKEIVDTIRQAVGALKKPPGCIGHLQRFLDATQEELSELVPNFKVQSTEIDPVEDLRALIKLTVDPMHIDSVCSWAIGTAKTEIEHLIKTGETRWLDADRFKSRFQAFIKSINLPNNWVSFGSSPSDEMVTDLLFDRPNFIRQLELIEVDEDGMIGAISDYLRTSADKTTWSAAGALFQTDIDDWDRDLLKRHSFLNDEINIVHANLPPSSKGKLIYGRCSSLQLPLDGKAVPAHFVHGSFNHLANNLRLGWHPEYQSLLSAKREA